jgi:hypothetical protein
MRRTDEEAHVCRKVRGFYRRDSGVSRVERQAMTRVSGHSGGVPTVPSGGLANARFSHPKQTIRGRHRSATNGACGAAIQYLVGRGGCQPSCRGSSATRRCDRRSLGHQEPVTGFKAGGLAQPSDDHVGGRAMLASVVDSIQIRPMKYPRSLPRLARVSRSLQPAAYSATQCSRLGEQTTPNVPSSRA